MQKADYLSKKNAHERDSHITFEEGPHIYTIDGDSDYTSVTSWNHSHFPKFNADLIIEKMMSSPRWPQSPYYGMTPDEIKTKWKNDGRAASEAGTIMHLNIEYFYNGLDVDEDDSSLEWAYFKQFEEKVGSSLNPYRTEWMVWDQELRLAGSVDMIFENPDGTLQIYDWKRSKEIKKDNRWDSALVDCISHLPNANFWHYSLQLNTYKYIIEKNYGKKVTDMFLVCLHPNNKNDSYIRYEVHNMTQEMDDLINLRIKNIPSVQTSNSIADTSMMTAAEAAETVDKLVQIKNKKKDMLADIEATVETLESRLLGYHDSSGMKTVFGKDYKVTFNKDDGFKVPDKKDLRRYELESALKEMNLWETLQEMSAYKLKKMLKSDEINSDHKEKLSELMDSDKKTRISLKKL
tara:strand:+ start:3575 stop:4792 length:1218 start_codon:yes stop_codon:yes gene_type:complete